MDGSLRVVKEWKEAKRVTTSANHQKKNPDQKKKSKWLPPEEGVLKINIDASFFPGADCFTVGMLIRDHQGLFVAGRTMKLPIIESVFEAEAIGVKEALSWVGDLQLQEKRLCLETDSLHTATAINKHVLNLLEVGDVIKECRLRMQNMTCTSVSFIRNQANKAAHFLAGYPCHAYDHVDFTSPPSYLLETHLFDQSK